MDVIILGAGLTGLSAAYHFEKNNFFDFCIFEQEKRCGGLARSVSHHGFTFDYTGHFLHSNDEYFKNFLDDTLRERRTITRQAFAFSHDTHVPYPFQSNLKNLPTEIIIECLIGFSQRNHQARDVKTFREWVLKYFGAGIGKHFFFPYNEKLLQQSVDKITPEWVGRFVPKITMKNILSNLIDGNIARNVGYNHTFEYPKTGGIETFVQALRKKIGAKIHTGYKAISIDIKRKKIIFENGKTSTYKKLITTIPLDNLLSIMHEPTYLNLRKQRQHLRHTSVVNFNLGYKKQNDDIKHWVYHPERKYDFYRVGFWHHVAPQLTPSHCGALYGEVAYAPHKHKNVPPKKIDRAIEQVTKIYGIHKNDIVIKKILHLAHAYVMYDEWRTKHLTHVHEALNRNAIFSVGRYGEWKYSSMQEAILDGAQVVKKILPEGIKKVSTATSGLDPLLESKESSSVG